MTDCPYCEKEVTFTLGNADGQQHSLPDATSVCVGDQWLYLHE